MAHVEATIYVGTYTNGGSASQGIYAMRLDLRTGELSAPVLVAETVNPSFLVCHPSKPVLYAANETDRFREYPGGGVSAFTIGARDAHTLALEPLNEQMSGGSGPCYVSVDRTGSVLLIANYGSGGIALLPLEANGCLMPPAAIVPHVGSSLDPDRQARPHAHAIIADPTNRFALAADLGLDRVLVYRLDSHAGMLAAHDPPGVALSPGRGPRHLAFCPKGRFLYVNGELTATIATFTWDAVRGLLQEVETISMLPHGYTGPRSAAELLIHPSGRFLYASHRGDDTIVIHAIDGEIGRLTRIGAVSTRGHTPRHFGIDPSGAYLLVANHDSDSIVAFRIDPRAGQLTATGGTATVPSPACVRFVATASAAIR